MNKILNNGIRIRTCAMPKQEGVTLLLKLHIGAAWEAKDRRGITHLVEHLCFRRFRGMGQADFYYEIEKIGGHLRGMTFRDCVMFEITVAKNHLPKAVEIIRGLFDENGWTYEDIRREKQVVLRQLECSGDWYHNQMMYDFFCRATAGEDVHGRKNHILNITKNAILEKKSELFSSGNAELIVVGDISETESDNISMAFCDIPKTSSKIYADITPVRFMERNGKDVHYYEDEVGKRVFSVSFDIDKEAIKPRYAEILGSALSKGLFSPFSLRLREELGILDEIDSGCEFYSFGGIMYFIFEATGDEAQKLFGAVSDVFEEQKKLLDERAFECSKVAFTDRVKFLQSTSRDFAYIMAFDDAVSSLEKYIADNNTVTYEEVSDAAKQIFAKENATIGFYNE